MYHLAKVLLVFQPDEKTFSSDASVQVQVLTWDEHVFTSMVHPSLNGKVKKDDYVLLQQTYPANQIIDHTVVKVLAKKSGEDAWKLYSDYLAKKKRMRNVPQQPITLDIPISDQPVHGGMIR